MKSFLFLLTLLLIIFSLITAGLFIGSFQTNLTTIYNFIFHYNNNDNTHYVILNLRLPRLILALLVGGSLALSGYLMQALTNNPLADPYILGTAAGGSLGANLVFFGLLPIFWLGLYLPALFAFLGSLSVTIIVVSISYQNGKMNVIRLLLGGVTITSLAGSLISLLIFLSSSDAKLKGIIFWTMGSFEKAQWNILLLPFIALLIVTIVFILLQKQISIMYLGEERAYHLGLNTNRLKWLIIILSSLITGVSVATSGPIGFVGLIIPHFTRSFFGINYKLNALMVTLTGAAFLLFCDLLTRLIYPPAGLPIGIICSCIGIPFFLYLLFKKNISE